MTENEFIAEYVSFLKRKRDMRNKLRDDLADLEVNFLDTQRAAIESGINVRQVQAAVQELKEMQETNNRRDAIFKARIKEAVEEYVNENKDDNES